MSDLPLRTKDMPNMNAKLSLALNRLSEAIAKFDPIRVYGLYSGGHDSLSACFIASLHPKFYGALHLNTGIGVEATREHVRETCKERFWRLTELHALENVNAKGKPDPQNYDLLVLQYGFPGGFHHTKMYNRLKERSLQRLERELGCRGGNKNPKRVMYVSGCRSDESERRMANTNETDVDGRRVWCAPIHDWTKGDISELLEYAKAKRNPVVDLIHKSGECLCGAFAKRGELAELALWPQTRPAYERIIALQKKVKAAGFPWGWEESPPKEYMEEKRGQIFMPSMKQYLCWSCGK